MTRTSAARHLHFGTSAVRRAGVTCRQYDIGIGTRRGGAPACFDRSAHLVAFAVSGGVFCIEPSVCLDGNSTLPKSMRAGLRTVFDRSNGEYDTYRRERLLGHPYEVLLERGAYDRAWVIRAVGFAPCGRNSAIDFYIPVKC